ncbi:MAG: NAD(P)H-dependent oxidoreductase subunit E [Gammaproteobacteria bacterium]|nr:NAD(P)H-dependent oxidoreductase subunit E [Gammaproteobacteria bacterium]
MTTGVKSQRKKLRGQQRGRQVDPSALQEIQSIIRTLPLRKDLMIEYLHLIQDKYQHISAKHMVALAHELKLAPTEVYEVATFYHHFDVVKENDTAPPALTVRVCDSITCEMFGAENLVNELQNFYSDQPVRVQRVPCVGRCAEAPIAVVGKNPINHAKLETVRNVVEAGNTDAPVSDYITYNNYINSGGYQLVNRYFDSTNSTETIIEIMKDSGLRGLGGAGFPAGKKWEIVRQQPGPRVLAVNIDEGEPGTFKDRHFLEKDPHRFLEGALIAAHVVEIDEIYIYLRDEYAGCYEILQHELDQLKKDPPFKLPHIELRRGAGAYICGEESAMIESIEGKRGMPRLRPPYLAQVGLFGRPTLEHNLETLFWVRDILEKGAPWFGLQGRNDRRGMRSFSVSGRVKKPGVHITDAGITINELIEEHCGGMLDGHTFYGYFPGGASGGILPASMGDIPLDFDTLDEYDCFIGSAAIIVLSDKDSARVAATNAMRFFEHESCGQCTPCRVGTAKAVDLMEEKTWDIPLLQDLTGVMRDASICGLGQAAPNPMESVIKHFSHELNDKNS